MHRQQEITSAREECWPVAAPVGLPLSAS